MPIIRSAEMFEAMREAPMRKGSTEFDASLKQYRITGAGATIWARQDQFQFVWKEMSGDVAVTATMQFLGERAAHRKAGIMLRQTLDSDSLYVDVVIHGDGMPAVQWRNAKGDITNTFDLPFDGPGKFRLKLVRRGSTVTAWVGKDGAELKEVGHTQTQLARAGSRSRRAGAPGPGSPASRAAVWRGG
jgi:TolB protein